MGWVKAAVSPRVKARSGRWAAGFVVAVLIWVWPGNGAEAARFIDYLYVEANEGDSSGGHVAMRFANQAFHFQHENPGILRIRRHDSAAFNHAYTMLGNRAIRESRIAVSDETYELLRTAFVRVLLVQDAQLEIREALRQEVSLFEMLLRHRRYQELGLDDASLPIKGLGFFLPDGPPSPEVTRSSEAGEHGSVGASSRALLSLQNRIHAIHGERFVEERIALAKTMLQQMDLRASTPPVTSLSPDVYPTADSSAATRYVQTHHALFALEVLHGALPILPESVWTSNDDAFRLHPQDVQALRAFADRQERDLVSLVHSSRSDWAVPFLLGMARLAAVEASLSSGRFVFLDLFPRDDREPSRDDTAERTYLQAMENEIREDFLRRRSEFLTVEGEREAGYAALERAGNLLLDIGRARVTGRPLRSPPGVAFPSREAWRRDLVLPRMDVAILARELEISRSAERDYEAALSRLYSYDLIRRNCVTELFAVINRAMAGLPAAHEPGNLPTTDAVDLVSEESVRRLGGFVDASRGFSFIPFVSAREVDACYGVVARQERPSYRTAQLAKMMEHESPLMVFLRESNTLTSTAYRPGSGDSSFLFFTDDTLVLRPLFGAFNLLVGLGQSLLGVVTLPFEGPDRLISGTRGVLFSVPELAFVNLRKGSMAYVERSPELIPGDGDPALPRP